jgi:TetR/AcrR family transcriptional regulator, transcriptional repressor for nem operon
MRKSKVETARTRERILEAAGSQFLTHGLTDAGLARVMKAAGLTHGGFYRHFASKDELVAEACRKAFSSLTADLESHAGRQSAKQGLPEVMGRYVSRGHKNHPATGCPLAFLGSELARADLRTRQEATEGFLRIVQLIARQLKHIPAERVEEQSLAIVAAMVGAVTLARIVPDSRISNSILAATRAQILKSTRGRG